MILRVESRFWYPWNMLLLYLVLLCIEMLHKEYGRPENTYYVLLMWACSCSLSCDSTGRFIWARHNFPFLFSLSNNLSLRLGVGDGLIPGPFSLLFLTKKARESINSKLTPSPGIHIKRTLAVWRRLKGIDQWKDRRIWKLWKLAHVVAWWINRGV